MADKGKLLLPQKPIRWRAFTSGDPDDDWLSEAAELFARILLLANDSLHIFLLVKGEERKGT